MLEVKLDQLRADAVLPDDVRPERRVATALGNVLLTGATGFVGAYLLDVLLRETSAVVTCLVRREDGRSRLRDVLESRDLWREEWAERIQVVGGDLRRPDLGWSDAEQGRLADSLDAIFHAGAAVNWVRSYAGLRATNVLGTLALLRLACRGRAKPFHYLSTLGVCYATALDGRVVSEADDPWPFVEQLHLPYAQSKCVAEQLVVQAQQRGLPTVIYRPTLIAGDSVSGSANVEDFLSRGISGCVAMGCAPDADWSIDACPVDHVARSVVRYARTGRDGDILHLLHPQARHWRELVLWMRLRGYPVRLVPYARWLRQLEQTAREPRHPLYPLLGFFRARVDGVTLPETYVGRCRSPVSDAWTRATLRELGVCCPDLGAEWLDRYFASLAAQGLLPPIKARGRSRVPSGTSPWEERGPVRQTGPTQSILTELASWQSGSAIGVFRQRVDAGAERRSVVIKVKTDDQPLFDVLSASTAMLDRRLGAACERWHAYLGLAGGHLREIALYQQSDERWCRYTPKVHEATWDEDRRRGTLVLEDLSTTSWMDPHPGITNWTVEQIETAVRGLAELQAIWFDRSGELMTQPWLGHVFHAANVVEMADWWSALAKHAARYFVAWLGPDARRLQRRLLLRLERWWPRLEELPRTLVHGDFTSRNLALRHVEGGLRLCAYDWELATLAVPQHDLAQLLCFVLPYDCTRETVRHYLELHREALQAATGHRFDAREWSHGFGLALADLFVNRFATYTLVHAVRRQAFLERIVHTWRTLYAYYDPL